MFSSWHQTFMAFIINIIHLESPPICLTRRVFSISPTFCTEMRYFIPFLIQNQEVL